MHSISSSSVSEDEVSSSGVLNGGLAANAGLLGAAILLVGATFVVAVGVLKVLDCSIFAGAAGMVHFELGSEPIVSTFHVVNSQGKDFRLRANDKIMILDCGGGTIDAACISIEPIDAENESSNNNGGFKYNLSELHHGDGIRAGGLDVDKAFVELLTKLLPNDIIEPIVTNQPAQWMRQKQKFVLATFSCPLCIGFVKEED